MNNALENNDDEGLKVEFQSLDTLLYSDHGYILEIYVERVRNETDDEIFVDLADCKSWNIPRDVILTNDDRRLIGMNIKAELSKKGIQSVIEFE